MIRMASRKPELRVVDATEEAPAAPPKTVTQAAETGTTRELLVAMRTRIAKAVEDMNTPARELASLTKRLTEVVHDIEAIDAREEQEAKSNDEATDQPYDASAI